MKIRKIASVALLSIAVLGACGNKPNKQSEAVEPSTTQSTANQEELQKAKQDQRLAKDKELYADTLQKVEQDNSIQHATHYLFYDFDHDGQDELLTGRMQSDGNGNKVATILAVYYLKNGTPTFLVQDGGFSFQEGSNGHESFSLLSDDNVYYAEWSGADTSGQATVYRFENSIPVIVKQENFKHMAGNAEGTGAQESDARVVVGYTADDIVDTTDLGWQPFERYKETDEIMNQLQGTWESDNNLHGHVELSIVSNNITKTSIPLEEQDSNIEQSTDYFFIESVEKVAEKDNTYILREPGDKDGKIGADLINKIGAGFGGGSPNPRPHDWHLVYAVTIDQDILTYCAYTQKMSKGTRSTINRT